MKNNKKGGKNNKSFNKKSGFSSYTPTKKSFDSPAEEIKISEITLKHTKKTVMLSGIVDKIAQTGGPTVFYLVDGTGTLPLKAFEGPGVRAYAEIEEGDAIKVTVKIEEFRDELEGDISKLSKLSDKQKEFIFQEIKDIQRKNAEVKAPEFLIKSQILDKLKPKFIKAATEIRLAVMQNRPIIIRHHNDADGYSSGFALERAILPLIEKQHLSNKAAWEFYTRAPCAAPFYEIDDSIRDTANSLRNVAKFSNKMPLVIIADNGSSPEDLMAIKQGKIHGMDFIVIDHHVLGEKDVISSEVLAHINPFLVDEDGSHFSAGMLCTEIARFINPDVKNIEQIAGMAGIADRIELNNPKAVEDYLKLAKKAGYSKELLKDIATVIDFVSAKVRFMEVREYIEVLFGEPREKQKELVDLMAPYINELDKKGLEIGKSTAQIEKLGKVNFQSVDIDKTFPGFGFFPKPGRVIGMIHDFAKEEKNMPSLVTAGLMGTAITLRATDEANFSVHDLIAFIEKKLPSAFVQGGGHKNAGSITFTPNSQEKVIELLKEFIKSR
tara:strand:+ start:125 stop:1780 length:1656 start_codon:yes stop_codon:yes gene_type:complete